MMYVFLNAFIVASALKCTAVVIVTARLLKKD
jgi:hypothetical protein